MPIGTVESVGATLTIRETTFCRAGDEPTISSNIDIWSISSTAPDFLCGAGLSVSWSRRRRLYRIQIFPSAGYWD